MISTTHVRRWAAEAVDLGRDLVREWQEDRVGGLAAEVAFFGLLSLFPALLATAAALGSLEAVAGGDVASRAEEEVIDFLRRVLTEEAAGTVYAAQGLFRTTRSEERTSELRSREN